MSLADNGNFSAKLQRNQNTNPGWDYINSCLADFAWRRIRDRATGELKTGSNSCGISVCSSDCEKVRGVWVRPTSHEREIARIREKIEETNRRRNSVSPDGCPNCKTGPTRTSTNQKRRVKSVCLSNAPTKPSTKVRSNSNRELKTSENQSRPVRCKRKETVKYQIRCEF